jgi:hypothetical protein
MTPKEKAKVEATRLVNSFYDTNYHANSIEVRAETAKKNALIAADKIITTIGEMEDPTMFIEGKWVNYQDYWIEVKQQIERI